MSLQALSAFAVANNFTKAVKPQATPLYELPIEQARSKVTVRDGNKVPKPDGSQALILSLGKVILKLDVIAPKATRINAPATEVANFTKILKDAVAEGQLDAEIQDAQLKMMENKLKADAAVKAVPTVEGTQAVAQAVPAGLDLCAIE